MLSEIEQRQEDRYALIADNLLRSFKASIGDGLADLYNAQELRIGYNITTVYQGLTAALPDNPRYGWTTDHDLIFALDLLDRGQPTAGKAVAGVLITDRLGILRLMADPYANRFNSGQPGCGNFYTAGEIASKQWPLTPNAGYSKLTIWNQPGGLVYNWVKVNAQTRDQYGVEACYRFPLFTDLDLTLAYQYVFNPANAVSTDPDTVLLADGSALSLRLRTTF